MEKKISATEARRKVLDECNIRYKVNENLEFQFDSKSDEEKAVKALKSALEL